MLEKKVVPNKSGIEHRTPSKIKYDTESRNASRLHNVLDIQCGALQ